MSEEEYEQMMNEANKLFKGYRDKYKGKTKHINGKGNMTLEQFKKELILLLHGRFVVTFVLMLS